MGSGPSSLLSTGYLLVLQFYVLLMHLTPKLLLDLRGFLERW